MPLYEITPDQFRPIEERSLAELKIKERSDLQRMLRSQIDILGENLFVLTEEFGDWDDSRRRIDLLAVDTDANLVVIELKRTQDGGHMELQALRYASMVSTMTFERATEIHADYVQRTGGDPARARGNLERFLAREESGAAEFANDVRIILVSEDFGRELTTTVLWLRKRDIDIRCIRLRPYLDQGRKLVDIQQIIPLPEEHEYQIQLREKEQEERKHKAGGQELLTRFWQGVAEIARSRNTRHAHITPRPQHWFGASAGIGGFALNYIVVRTYAVVELNIDRKNKAESKALYERLLARRVEIESTFGSPLEWDQVDERQSCKVRFYLRDGGSRSPESEWPRIQSGMVDAMVRLEAALEPVLATLGV
ncbi:hypothetical protein ASA1KI_29490 [Opitutales bacterium ASA1]|uniref:DUF4268 domain-containing protein n=1 Tax=Congregicoccus parvus TaxID=3081749 RepID=UPI002B2C7AEF|nr:hypothetical protein ASA1KI_29490 [Opitutales bacterium ASA1]